MAVEQRLDTYISKTGFQRVEYTLPTSGDFQNVQDNRNRDRIAMEDNIHHFSQTKVDLLPRLFNQGADFGNANFISSPRIGQVEYLPKTQALSKTLFTKFEVDNIMATSSLWYLALLEDVDLKRKEAYSIDVAKQMEITFAMSRVKDRACQQACVMTFPQIQTNPNSGTYQGANVIGTEALGDGQLKVVPNKVDSSPSGTANVGAIYQENMDFLDDLEQSLEEANKDLMNAVIVGPSMLHRHIKRIIDYRDMRSSVLFYKNAYGKMIEYVDEGVLFIFLRPDVYWNLADQFHSKNFVKATGEITTASAGSTVQALGNIGIQDVPNDKQGAYTGSGKTPLIRGVPKASVDGSTGAVLPYATFLVILEKGMTYHPDAGARFSAKGTMPEQHFGLIDYSKFGFGACRVDRTNVRLYLFNTSLTLGQRPTEFARTSTRTG